MGLGNALQLSATGKEHSSLWWHGMRSAQTIFRQSLFCLAQSQPVVIGNLFNVNKSYSEDKFAPCSNGECAKLILSYTKQIPYEHKNSEDLNSSFNFNFNLMTFKSFHKILYP